MTIPILEIPKDIKSLCSQYRENFSTPQFKNFERFITGLIVNDQADIQALSSSFNLGKHYDSLHHFLSESSWDIEEVFRTSILMIKHLPDTSRSFSDKGYLLIDDTLIEKFGKFMEATGKLYDHNDGRFLDYAHCLVALIYVDCRGNRYPLRFDLYRTEEDCKKSTEKFRTKIVIAKELVSYAIQNGVPFQGVIFDSWYFSKELADFIEKQGKDWFSIAKSNRLARVGGKNTPLSEYAKTVPKRGLEKITVDANSYRYHSLKASMPSLERGRETIRIVVSYEYDHNQKLKGPVFLVSNRKDWRVERILRTYTMRWSIETYFRDAKQYLGLGDYQVRGLQGTRSHWCLVFTSAVVLELIRAHCIQKEGSSALDLSVGALCQRAFNETLRSIIRWVIEQVRNAAIPEEKILAALGAL